jgi:ribosomal protein S12 methylthiotransferase accessory factor
MEQMMPDAPPSIMQFCEPVQVTLSDVVRNGLRLVSHKTGIIKGVFEQALEQDDPLVYSFGALMSDTTKYSRHKCGTRSGGAGLTRDHAFAAAVGEAIERYCSNFYDPESFTYGSYNSVGEVSVPPEDFILFSKKQYLSKGFPFIPFEHTTQVCWVRMFSLVDRVWKFVPSCFVYLPYAPQKPEAPIGPVISTGLSCATSLEEAVLSGIYECVERDAFTIMWLNRLEMPVVNDVKVDAKIGRLFLEKFCSSHLHHYICDITTDLGIPSVFALTLGGSTEGMLASVGSAARLDGKAAILKALIESAQGRPFLRYELRQEPNRRYKEDFSDVRSFDDHARLYSCMSELIEKLLFIRNGPSKAVSDIPDLATGSVLGDIGFCVRKLAAKGFDVLVADLTTRDVASAGFRVARVIIPGLQPLHGDHNYRFLGGRRLYRTPRIMGLAESDTSEDDLNPWPHPFP